MTGLPAIARLKQGVDAVMSATALLQGSDVVISDEYTFRLLRTGATVRPLDATDAATVPIDASGGEA